MNYIVEIDGMIEKSGTRQAFILKISEPVENAENGDFFCRVHAPMLVKSDKRIFGVDSEQAKELALQFVKDLLDDARVLDKNGELIEF